ncbi:MAG: class C beta-lactamase [Pseudomonadota bacterium]
MNALRRLAARIAITFISAACCVPLSSWADHDPAKIRAVVDTTIQPLMAEHEVPGMAVAVTVDGQAFVFHYGVASREANTPVGEATLFELGSISKTFAATLASYAQVRGQLSLDDHPGRYIPELKGSAINKASLLNLGTYTAGGLPLQFPDGVTDDQMTDYFRHWKPHAAPGILRRYSNPSIGLLGYITALAMHTDFADAMENQIFPQLGLTGSYIRVPDHAMVHYAWGYDTTNKAIRVNPGVLATQAYGIKSTVTDMIRYVQANIDPSQLEESMQRAVDGTHVGYFRSGDMVQGLGWEQYHYPVTLKRLLSGNSYTMILKPVAAKKLSKPQVPSGPTLFNKTGSTGGFGAYVAFVPQKKLGIVMLANKNYPIPARIEAAHAILEQLAPLAK